MIAPSSLVPGLLVSLSMVASCTDGALAPTSAPDASGGLADAGAHAETPDGLDAGEARDAGALPAPLGIPGRFARSAHLLGDGAWAVLTERPKSLADPTERDPDRALAWVGPEGVIHCFVQAPAGRALLDVAVHPSGEVTVLHASAEGFFLGRYGLDRKPGAYFQLSTRRS